MSTQVQFNGELVTAYTNDELQAKWNEKPHLVLPFVQDYNTQKCTCVINDTLKYESIDGGITSIDKYTRATVNDPWVLQESIHPNDWGTEKFWISENFGAQFGYYQPNYSLYKIKDNDGRIELLSNGFGPDLRYIDHLQRLQGVMEGEDCAWIYVITTGDKPVMFETPDNGKTIFKREKTAYKTFYANPMVEDPVFFDHPQPCAMQPYTIGRILSSYDEMTERGVPQNIVDQCKAGQIPDPKNKDLQKYFVYPTSTTPTILPSSTANPA